MANPQKKTLDEALEGVLPDLDALVGGEDEDEDEEWDEGAEEYDEDEDEVDIPAGPLGRRRAAAPYAGRQTPMIQGELLRRGDAYQLIVQERTATGEITERGRLPPDASVEHLIELVRSPGNFLITPINNAATALSQPVLKSIPPQHPHLMGLMAGGAMPGFGGPTPLQNPQEMLSLIREFRGEGLSAAENERLRAEAERQRYEDAQAKLWEERAELGSSRMELAAQTAADLSNIYTQQQERENERQRAHEERVAREFQASLERERKASEERIKMSGEQNNSMMQFLMMQQQEADRRRAHEMEMERARREREDRQREERRREEDRRQREFLALQQQQQRQMMQQQMAMVQQQYKGKEDLLGLQQAIMLKAQDSRDPIQQLAQLQQIMAIVGAMQPGTQPPGFMDRLMDLAQATIPQVAPAFVNAVAEPPPMLEGSAPPQIPEYDPDTMQVVEPPPDPASLGLPPGVEIFSPPPLPPGAGGAPEQSEVLDVHAVITGAQEPVGAPAPVSHAVPADVRNKARRIARNMVGAIEAAPEADWPAAFVAQLMQDKEAMQAYLQTVPVYKTLTDAGLSSEKSAKLVGLLREKGIDQQYQIKLD